MIADLLLRGVSPGAWHRKVVQDNVLQISSFKTAIRIGTLLRSRLLVMKPPLWEMVRDGSTMVATHACFAAAVKHSPLLGDFLDLVVREKYRLFSPNLSYTDWEQYIEECRGRDPYMSPWSASTVTRLRSTVLGILAQVGYIENVHNLRLQAVYIAREVLNYLQKENETYVLRCMQVQP